MPTSARWAARLLLFGTLLLSCWHAWERVRQTPDEAVACDMFGHLQHLKGLRVAAAERTWPRFDLRNEQTDRLIEFLKAAPVDAVDWQWLVAPHAFAYHRDSDKLVNQYPPGTAAVLALAGIVTGDPRHTIRGTLAIVLITALVVWLGFLVWDVRHPSLVGLAAATVLCQYLPFCIRDFDLGSPSIPAVLAPVLLGTMCMHAAKVAAQPTRGVLLATLGGALLGSSVLIRIPNALLLPFFFFLVRGRARWAFVAAAVVTGIVPLLLYQSAYAGAWYRSTYSALDASPPGLEWLRHHLLYYFVEQPTGGYVWATALVVLLAALCGRFRLLWRTSWVWLPTIAFLLTHQIAIYYYPIPAYLAWLTLLALELVRSPEPRPQLPPPVRAATVALALLGPLATSAVPALVLGLQPLWSVVAPRERADIPPELLRPTAWIWSDMNSGSFWYYGDHAAFRLAFGHEKVTEPISRWVASRGEQQFLVIDGFWSKKAFQTLTQAGARLTKAGTVFQCDYYEVVW